MITVEYVDDGTLPALLKPQIVAQIPEYPGVEMHVIRFEPRPGDVAYCFRHYFIREERWQGSFATTIAAAGDLGQVLCDNAVSPRQTL